FTAPDTLFWFRKSSHGSFGPWINRNQYAGFMVMTCPLLLALAFLHQPRTDSQASIRERFVTLFSEAGANLYFLFACGAFFILSSILLTQSRGGILSIFCTMLLFFLFLIIKQGKKALRTPLLLFSVLFFTAGWLNGEAILNRFSILLNLETGGIENDRLLIWRDTLEIIADSPLAGFGFGTFIDIFPGYKTFIDQLVYEHAHNDYLELLTDGGLVGFCLGACFLGTVLANGFRQIFRRRDRLAVLSSIGAFCGMSALLLYSITDFNLHNGANGLYFFFLCGLLVASGHIRQHYQSRPTLLTPLETGTSSVRIRIIGLLATSLLLLAVIRLHGGSILAAKEYRQAGKVSVSSLGVKEKLTKMTALLQRARTNAPFNALYPSALARMSKYQQDDAQALQLYGVALFLQPLESKFLQAAGALLASTDPDNARILLENSYKRAREKEEALRRWAE
ncbi:MAG: O-antigen ligase domain-containing protein, partial [Candidatus Electrothrix sp. AR3]|nr:O-antigen ligase domain-containing protein [Candidatus Electrothrix sp. AR3]